MQDLLAGDHRMTALLEQGEAATVRKFIFFKYRTDILAPDQAVSECAIPARMGLFLITDLRKGRGSALLLLFTFNSHAQPLPCIRSCLMEF